MYSRNRPTPSVMVNGHIMCDQVVLLLVHFVLLLHLTVTKTYASVCNITSDVTQLLTDISSCYNNAKTVTSLELWHIFVSHFSNKHKCSKYGYSEF